MPNLNLTPLNLLGLEALPNLLENRRLLEKTAGLVEDRRRLMLSRISVAENGCWLWLGTKHERGYGLLGCGGRKRRTHRLMWMLVHGPIPDAMKVCHKCDVTGCCNPEHLFKGTQLDNMNDMARKGRKPVGSKCPWSILSDVAVMEIRRRKLARESAQALASEFAVSESAIYKIAQGTRWGHSHSGFSPEIRAEIEGFLA